MNRSHSRIRSHTAETKQKISIGNKHPKGPTGQYFICNCPEGWIIRMGNRCTICGKLR